MAAATLKTRLERAGYTVSEAASGYDDHPVTYRVEGHGSSVIVAADDVDTVAALVEQASAPAPEQSGPPAHPTEEE